MNIDGINKVRKSIIAVLLLLIFGATMKKDNNDIKIYRITPESLGDLYSNLCSNHSSYKRVSNRVIAIVLTSKDSTIGCVSLGGENEPELYYDTTSLNPKVFISVGMEEDPIKKYVQYDNFPLIAVASFWGDGADYEYCFSEIDNEIISYYHVVAYYYLDTITDTILNVPPHEDTIITKFYLTDLFYHKCQINNHTE